MNRTEIWSVRFGSFFLWWCVVGAVFSLMQKGLEINMKRVMTEETCGPTLSYVPSSSIKYLNLLHFKKCFRTWFNIKLKKKKKGENVVVLKKEGSTGRNGINIFVYHGFVEWKTIKLKKEWNWHWKEIQGTWDKVLYDLCS